MDMNRIIGVLVSGFACKLYAMGLAAMMAHSAYQGLASIADAFARLS